MPFPNYIGNKRLWTEERVVAALALAAVEIEGPLPCRDAVYSRIKKGRLNWPPASRILGYFHSMARAWRAAGAPMKRVTFYNIDWSDGEKEYVCARAGKDTLEDIALHLGRTYGGVKGLLRVMGTTARHNQGFLSAAEVAQEFNCPYHRVRMLLKDGVIKAQYNPKRNQWQVDPVNLTPSVVALLQVPKQTHKTWPTDLGDYYKRHGLHRRNGKVIRPA